MTRTQILAQFEELGIRTKDGKVCKADLERILGSGKDVADIEPDFKARFLALMADAENALSKLKHSSHQAELIAQKHDPSGFEIKGLVKVTELIEAVEEELSGVREACETDRKA